MASSPNFPKRWQDSQTGHLFLAYYRTACAELPLENPGTLCPNGRMPFLRGCTDVCFPKTEEWWGFLLPYMGKVDKLNKTPRAANCTLRVQPIPLSSPTSSGIPQCQRTIRSPSVQDSPTENIMKRHPDFDELKVLGFLSLMMSGMSIITVEVPSTDFLLVGQLYIHLQLP